jgi:hypothetical protein
MLELFKNKNILLFNYKTMYQRSANRIIARAKLRDMTEEQIDELLEDFEQYIIVKGWEDWMEDYLEKPGDIDYIPDEREIERIEDKQVDMFLKLKNLD